MPKNPTPQGISALLRKAGFERSVLRPKMNHRYTTGFYVQGAEAEVYVRWRPETPLVTPSPAQAERNKATALEMAGKYAEAVKAAGWPAAVIHLSGPLVRVTAKEG